MVIFSIERGMNWIKVLLGCLLSGGLCKDWELWMPENISVLTGSCVLIPCKFEIIKDYKGYSNKSTLSGVWIKHIPQFNNVESTVVYNNSIPKSENYLQGEILGDMKQNNCTTVLENIQKNYTDSYYFRIEDGKSPFGLTFNTKHVFINVSDSPQKPKITSLALQKQIKENTTVNLTCSVTAPCPKFTPALVWTPKVGHIVSQLQIEPNKSRSVSSVLTFTVSHLHHEKNITCTAHYQLQQGKSKEENQTVALKVLFSPKDTSATVNPPGPVSEGSSVTLTCYSKANPAVKNFTWYRASDNNVTKIGSGKILTINLTESVREWYYCEAQNPHGTQRSANIHLNLEGKSSVVSLVGGIAGFLVIIMSGGMFLIFWRWRKHKETADRTRLKVTKKQDEDNTNKAVFVDRTIDLQNPSEDVHYGEIDFSKHDKETNRRVQKQGPEPEAEYAEVRVSERPK